MWLLRNDEKGLIYRITPGKNHIISRKDGDLLLLDDQSISRKHAQLSVDNDNIKEGVVLKDLQSKYGTFTIIGDGEQTQLGGNQEITLRCGDVVRFGIQWNSWRLEFIPLLVATSTLTQAEKAEVQQMVSGLGGILTKDWQQDCTHLTMNKLTVTVKVVCALAAGQPIVTPAYWRALSQALSSLQTTLPDCASYQPPLVEAVLNPSEVSFSPNPARASLFKGHVFVASTAKQLARIKPMITAAGGRVDLYSPTAWPGSKFLSDKVVLMQHSMHEKAGSQQSQMPDGYLSVARNLKQQGVRTVPESEIGLGVLHCSVSQYCNPRFDVRSMLGSSSSLESTQPVNVLCPNTEATTDSQEPSADALTEPNECLKRPRENDVEDEPECKKQNTLKNSEDLFGTQNLNASPSPNHSNKRRLSLRKNKSPSIGGSTSSPDPPQSSPKPGTSSSNKGKASTIMPVQSLDMFAPSGSRSKPLPSQIVEEVRPSCEDLFASNASRKPDNENEILSERTTRRSTRTQEKKPDDDFSFKKQRMNNNNSICSKDDDFSFTKHNKPQPNLVENKEDDEFTFANNKSFKKPVRDLEENKDDFSFVSRRISKKRNRQSNPDMFEDISLPSTSKMAVENDENNIFAFENPKQKKQRLNNASESDVMESEVKIAMLTKETGRDVNANGMQTASEPQYAATDLNNLVTYSKSIPVATLVKEEVNEEVDELIKELQNATIVVMKSLIKPRNHVPQSEENGVVGKNFKKFRKVKPPNKRIVPHIIGGSDLVPHHQMYRGTSSIEDDNLIPDVPQKQDPSDDDWGFPKNKGRSH